MPALLFTKLFAVRTKIKEQDKDTLKLFGTVVGDYDGAHWYWELEASVHRADRTPRPRLGGPDRRGKFRRDRVLGCILLGPAVDSRLRIVLCRGQK